MLRREIWLLENAESADKLEKAWPMLSADRQGALASRIWTQALDYGGVEMPNASKAGSDCRTMILVIGTKLMEVEQAKA